MNGICFHNNGTNIFYNYKILYLPYYFVSFIFNFLSLLLIYNFLTLLLTCSSAMMVISYWRCWNNTRDYQIPIIAYYYLHQIRPIRMSLKLEQSWNYITWNNIPWATPEIRSLSFTLPQSLKLQYKLDQRKFN